MKSKFIIFFLPFFISLAIFANPFLKNSGYSDFFTKNIPSVQFDDSFSDSYESPMPENVRSHEGANWVGGVFIAFISVFCFVLFVVFLFIFIIRRKKMGTAAKVISLGCSIILFILFILSAIAALFIFFWPEDKNSGDSSTAISGSFVIEDKNIHSEYSEEELAKFAFEKFNNASKLYIDYQKNFNPELYQKAIEEIESALAADQDNPAYWLLAGKLYSEMSPDYDVQILAEDYLRKSLELDPKNIQALLTLANCLSLQERYYEAGELFKNVLSRDYYAFRDYLVPIITYTYIYDYQYSRAEKFLRQLLENDPGADVLRISLAVTLNMQGQGRADDAKNELRKIISKSDSPQLLKTYASNLFKNFDKWHDGRYQE